MAEKDVVLRVIVDSKGVFQGIEKTNNVLNDTAKKASGVSNELKKASTGILGIVNDLTGGLGSKFMDMKDAIGGATVGMKGFKAALVSTGIGALVVALGLIVENWDSIKESIASATNEAHANRIATEERAEASKKLVEGLALEERYLRAIGTAETDIAAIRRETTQQALDDQQARLKALQDEIDERSKKSGYGAIGNILFGTSLDELKEKMKEASDLAKGYTADLAEQKRKQIDDVFAANAKVLQAEKEAAAKQAEDAKRRREQAAKDRKWEIEDNAKELEKMSDQLAETQLQKLSEEIDAKNRLEIEGRKVLHTNLEYLDNTQAENDKQRAEEKRKRDAENTMLQVQMAEDAVGALGALAEGLFKNNEAGQKKAFNTNKAFSLAQAIINTYQAVNAALTAGGNPVKLATGAQFVEAGIALTTGLASVVKIARTKFDSGGGGGSTGGGGGASGGGSFSAGGGGGIAAPTAAIDFGFLNNTPKPQPIQAYVLPGNVTTSQEAREKIENQSRL